MAETIVGTTDNSGKPKIGKVASAASTNATSLKAGQSAMYGWHLFNGAAYAVFIKFYDKATVPTVGTDVPVFTLGIPAGQRADAHSPIGVPFTNGIAYAITKLVADSDVTVVAASDLTGYVRYL